MEPGTSPPAAPATPAAPAAVAPPVASGCPSHYKHLAISALIGLVAGAGIFLAVIHFTARRIVKKTPEPTV